MLSGVHPVYIASGFLASTIPEFPAQGEMVASQMLAM
jgi:hypothetical protein